MFIHKILWIIFFIKNLVKEMKIFILEFLFLCLDTAYLIAVDCVVIVIIFSTITDS